ncbi:f-box domain containing protein [Ophiostoma piceae UAMH 11346]|uniref:F-box domain containing protein n=1 Tax=Ophiostoma piceae (strain UAMH 11346) TaxID=1262450 RepID=S3C9S2_OPHP1|nr:f-box domain containing protein [Ophiostoma piceae UAMH 11346]
MEKFLAAALAPRAKRKAPVGQRDENGLALDNTSIAAKRPRPRHRPESDSKTLIATARDQPISAPEKQEATESKDTAPSIAESSSPLPSFRAVMASQGVSSGPTRTRMLCEKAEAAIKEGRFEDGIKLLTRALISCACQAPVRRQFKQAGVPLEAIDPIGQCSCRDFVAAAKARRKRPESFGSMPMNSSGKGAVASGDNGPFPVSELDLTAVHRLATDGASCMCGSGRARCALPDHLDTLDRLAAVAIKLGEVELASQVGQWHIDLAPHQAQGYLHLAKAILSKEEKEPESSESKIGLSKNNTKKTDARFVALCIYNHGRHNVREHGDPESPFLNILTRCCRQYSRGDFLPELPLETAEAILQQLSLPELLACLRVTKRWAAALRRVRLCLPAVDIPGAKFSQKKPQRQPPLKGLSKLLRSMPGLQARHLRIWFRSSPGPQYATFVEGALRHFQPHAECVELSTWWCDQDPLKPSQSPQYGREPSWPRLGMSLARTFSNRCRKLVLRGVDDNSTTSIMGIISWASESLEHLELIGRFNQIVEFPLPRLRVLKAVGGVWSNKIGLSLLPSICVAAPQLEQLWLEKVSIDGLNMSPPSAGETLPGFDIDSVDNVLRSLHTLHIGKGCSVIRTYPRFANAAVHIFPKLPAGMRNIDITCLSPDVVEVILFGSGRSLGPHEQYLPPFTDLEAFRCLAPVTSPHRLFEIIQPSLNDRDGRLAHLELDASETGVEFLRGDEPYRFLYPERLRTVGLHNFDWDGSSIYALVGGVLRGGQFVNWAEQFRHVESISVYPAWQGTESWTNHSDIKDGELLMALVERFAKNAKEDDGENWSKLRLRTIYQGIMRGSMIGVMESWQAMTFGQQMVQFPKGHAELRAPVFPWPDRVKETEAE